MPAIVERDNPAPRSGESRDPSGMNPIHGRGRCKAVHQNDGLALPFIKESDFNSVMIKAHHDAGGGRWGTFYPALGVGGAQ
jgi:hypothetical protein